MSQKATDTSRDVVLQYCRFLSDRNFEGMRSLVTDDMTWLVPGLKSRLSWAGEYTFDEILPNLVGFLGSLDRFVFTVKNTIVEDNKVSVEAASYGVLNGVVYENLYLMQFVLRARRIASLQEFLDQSRVIDFQERLEVLKA